MAHNVIQRETRAGMRYFRIIYRDLSTGEILNMVDTWADSVNEVYRETLKVSLSAGVISELVDTKWIERLGFSNPAVAK